MELPEIARRIGTIDRNRIVYIEEYVLQYLKTYGYENLSDEERISLYGRHEYREGINIYIIYAACRESEEQMLWETSSKDKENYNYERIGRLRHKSHSAATQQAKEVALKGENQAGPLQGYYIFYDSNEKMKDYLAQHYEQQMGQVQKPIIEEQPDDVNARTAKEELAELIALSRSNIGQPSFLYRWIRMAVICILIIFCAIAVTTINAHHKMGDFVQTIIQTNEWMENKAETNEF